MTDDPNSQVNPKVAELYGYWSLMRNGRAMPARDDIDPVAISGLLPDVFLVDVERNPMRFRFRLVGTEIVARYGEEITGRALDELDLGGKTADIARKYRGIVERQAPSYGVQEIRKRDGRWLRYERLLLPLSRNGIDVDMALGGAWILPIDR
ncbi:MAG: PAS domain-containing protein [Alphaproteobacteria bacterium]|nr:PAS domain-containing protein [Alphaproteobacteria bacterium]